MPLGRVTLLRDQKAPDPSPPFTTRCHGARSTRAASARSVLGRSPPGRLVARERDPPAHAYPLWRTNRYAILASIPTPCPEKGSENRELYTGFEVTRTIKIMPGNTPPDTPSSKLVPLSQNQLKAILDAARRDDLLHPLLTAAAYTGLRLGDLCNLKWSAVDLAAGFVTVPATTTHQTVKLPILPPLREVLESRHASRDKSRVFVFPEAARRYNSRNEHGVPTLRGSLLTGVKVFIGQALNAVPLPDKPDEAKSLPSVPDIIERCRRS